MLLICESLGVSLKEEKSTMANTQLVFLGIEIDTQAMEMPLPLEKLDKIKQSLDSMKYKRKIRLRELQSLIGPKFCLSGGSTRSYICKTAYQLD